MNNTIQHIEIRLNQAEEKICEHKYRSFEIMWSHEKKKELKVMKNLKAYQQENEYKQCGSPRKRRYKEEELI